MLCGVSYSTAQQQTDFNNYTPLRCSGELPADFTKPASLKYRESLQADQGTGTAAEIAARDKFLLQSSFLIDELLLSGKVLFNDPITGYVNKVADKLLAGEPELRSKLRFYCIKSSQVNAFSTNQGIIFVTLGLVSQLENEAQLAFILSHEIVHFEKKHTINSYVENDKIFSKKGEYKYSNLEEKITLASSYSKEKELEADSLGLKRLLRSSYNPKEAVNVMLVLQFSHLPFAETTFKPAFLENEKMVFPKNFFLDSLKQFNFDSENEDDSKSSHPNIRKRRQLIEGMLADAKPGGNALFLNDKKEFDYIQKISRFETVRINLLERNYCEALYTAQVLQKDEPGSRFLETAIAKSLYGMTKYSNVGIANINSKRTYDEIEGNMQQVFYWFEKQNHAQLAAVSLRYAADLYRKYNDPYLRSIAEDLALELVSDEKLGMADFTEAEKLYDAATAAKTDTTAKADTLKKPENGEEVPLSKYDKIKKQQKKEELKKITSEDVDESKFHLLAFSGRPDNTDLKQFFAEAQTRSDKAEKKKEEENQKRRSRSGYEQRKAIAEQQRENLSRTSGAAIDSLVIVDPFYFLIDEKKGVLFLESEKGQESFSRIIDSLFGNAGIYTYMIATKNLASTDVEKYNDMAALNEWMGERMKHKEELEFIPIETDHVSYIISKKGIDHLGYTGMVSVKGKNKGRAPVVIFTTVFFPLLPFGVWYAVKPKYSTEFYTLIFNIRTGEITMASYQAAASHPGSKPVKRLMDREIRLMKKPKTKAVAD